MPKYKYTVVNQNGKTLTGLVETFDDSTAREELNKLGFSIISLEESQENETPASSSNNKNRFAFEAIDKANRPISGTVPAENEKSAFYKLKNEYELTITALWPENSDKATIEQARQEGTRRLQALLLAEEEENNNRLIEETNTKKDEIFTRTKIENVLRSVNEILSNYEADFDPEAKTLIHQKIDKVLRIKNSTNLEYILANAEELLLTIQKQELRLKEKGLQDKQFKLALTTRDLLNDLKKSSKPKNLREDILNRITDWEIKNKNKNTFLKKIIFGIFQKIKHQLYVPPEISMLKEQIYNYNKQIRNLILIYFKESSPEYRQKIKNSLKTVWLEKKKTKEKIQEIRKQIQEKYNFKNSATKVADLNSIFTEISGYFLFTYLTYYFIAKYLTTKNFGFFSNKQLIPQIFHIQESTIFKSILITVFVLHCSFAIKKNFFNKNKIASLIIFSLAIFLSIIGILNF